MKDVRGRLFHFLHWDGPGGGPVVATQLLQGLQQEWNQAVVADGDGRMAEWCRRHGAPFHRLPMFPLWRAVLGWPLLVALLRREKPDVVMLHGQWAGPVGAAACRLAGVKRVLYIAHCPAFYHSNRPLRALRNYLAESLPLRWSHRTVVLSAGSWRNYMYRQWGPEDRLVLIPNGVDLSRRPGEGEVRKFRQDRGWKEEEFHAVFVGRLADQKRPDWMLSAWEAFHRRASPRTGRAVLHLVGEGPERRTLEIFTRQRGLADSVKFEGEQDSSLDWIAASDLVVMTSLFEGHALVPLEAMLCRRPILAMKVDGVEESVEDGCTGRLIPVGDVEKFAEALAELARNREARERMGAEAGRRAERWNWENSLGKYRELLCKRKASW